MLKRNIKITSRLFSREATYGSPDANPGNFSPPGGGVVIKPQPNRVNWVIHTRVRRPISRQKLGMNRVYLWIVRQDGAVCLRCCIISLLWKTASWKQWSISIRLFNSQIRTWKERRSDFAGPKATSTFQVSTFQ